MAAVCTEWGFEEGIRVRNLIHVEVWGRYMGSVIRERNNDKLLTNF